MYDTIPALTEEIQRNKASLSDFKIWLSGSERQRRLFKTPEDLSLEITRALNRWLNEHPQFRPAHVVVGFDRIAYLEWVQRGCESVELLDLDKNEASNVRRQQVYVPAMVNWDQPDRKALKQLNIELDKDSQRETSEPTRITLPLLLRLGVQSLYVAGAPGAGKSTFCRWLALVSARGNVPEHPIPAPDDYTERLPADLSGRVPILCYLRDLNDHKELLRGSGRWSRKKLEDALAAWLDQTQPSELTGDAWRALLEQGKCLMILDGVDELHAQYKDSQGSHQPRANFLSGLADALPTWLKQGNRILLTSRPYGLSAARSARRKSARI